MRCLLSLLLFVLPVLGAALVTRQLIAEAPPPARVTAAHAGLAVRVVTLVEAPLVPVAQGWGNVRAAQVWTAVSEVRGAVVWRDPDLAAGRLVRAGTPILRIDPADYLLAIGQAEADLASLAAEAEQIAAEAANTTRVLDLEAARLALTEADVRRIRELAAQGSAAPARVDEAERGALGARRVVVELQNALELIAPRQARNAAQVARTEAQLARARRDLAHTEIVAPFDLRITQAPVEQFQAVAVGQVLASGEGVAQVEVLVQLPLAAFRRLLTGFHMEADVFAQMEADPARGISVTLEPLGNPGQIWQGRADRVEPALEPRARSVQVVVVVDDPITGARPPERVPLIGNLQVQVTFEGPEQPGLIAIPASALHGGLVYLVDDESRLELRPVEIAFRQGDLAVIASGLAAGERLVLDDIAPAIPGQPLRAVAP